MLDPSEGNSFGANRERLTPSGREELHFTGLTQGWMGKGSINRNFSRRSGPTIASRSLTSGGGSCSLSASMASPITGPVPVEAVPSNVASPSAAGVAIRFLGPMPFMKVLEVRTRAGLPSMEIDEIVSRMYPGVRIGLTDFASTTRPVTRLPGPARTWPFNTKGSSSTAAKVSLECARALDKDFRSRITIAVPGGTCAPGGTTELVGEIPPLCASRSKGRRAPSAGVIAPDATIGTED
jgi:hypothetical protein